MIDDQFILGIERLRDELGDLKVSLRDRYHAADRQVTAEDLKEHAARIAEKWMVGCGPAIERLGIISSDYLADLNVHFQRLLTLSERASRRKLYELEIKAVLRRITGELIIPLKRFFRQGTLTRLDHRMESVNPQAATLPSGKTADEFQPTAFVAHSFSSNDNIVVDCVLRTLGTLGVAVVTGEKPRADRISEKVKRLIDGQYLFIGVFTQREKIARRKEWTTSAWLIDEKAYAVGKGKKLILLKEDGVESIGGIQGDYQFVEFSRDRLHEIPIALLNILNVTAKGLRS